MVFELNNTLEAIYNASLKFLEVQTLEDTYKTVVSEALRLIGADFGSVILKSKDGFEKVYSSSPELYKIKVRKKGYTYRICKKNTAFVVEYSKFKEVHPDLIKMGINSSVNIPLSNNKKIIGSLSLDSYKKEYFSENDLKILKVYGSLASIAIKKAQSHEEMEKDKDILEKIQKSSLKFLIPLSLEETYKIITQEAIKLINGDDGLLVLELKGVLKNVYGSSKAASAAVFRKRGYTYKAFKKGIAFVLHDKDYEKIHPEAIKLGLKTSIFIPLSYKGKSTGVVVIRFSNERFFSIKELNTLKLFGSMASLAIRKCQLYEEVNKLLKLQNMFIAMAAHELRTPLTSINGYIQLLHIKLSNLNSTEKRWIENLLTESARLTNLVNELLEINRIKTGKFNYLLQECRLKNILKRACDNFYFSYPNRIIIINDDLKDAYDKIIGDKEKLQQVFFNLLENAAKFSKPDTEILLDIKQKSRYLSILIKDKGEGIAKEEIPKITEGFYRKSKYSEQGMGLGLFLAKNIIDYHHGILKIRSKLNQETAIEVKLPKLKI